MEITTDRGHILALAPEPDGKPILDELRNRVPLIDGAGRLCSASGRARRAKGQRTRDLFRNYVVLVGAHVDKPGSVLGSNQAGSLDDQISLAQTLQGLEVVGSANLLEWRRGIKQTDVVMALLQGSDAQSDS